MIGKAPPIHAHDPAHSRKALVEEPSYTLSENVERSVLPARPADPHV